MGGPVIETIRPGVQFAPEAARAFRRANAQVRAEVGRDIDVNSTYRDWDTQLRMYNAWQAYITGRGPHPGHSKALHPADPLAFHTKGLALDSDDWTNARIVQILAEHGFIRNRLYVPNERHHFEYLRDHDQHRNDPAPAGLEGDDMSVQDIYNARDADGRNMLDLGRQIRADLAQLRGVVGRVVYDSRDGDGRNALDLGRQARADVAAVKTSVEAVAAEVARIRADVNYIHQVSPYSLKAILEASKKGAVSLTDEQAEAIAGQLSAVAVESLAAALDDDFEAVKARLQELPQETLKALKEAL